MRNVRLGAPKSAGDAAQKLRVEPGRAVGRGVVIYLSTCVWLMVIVLLADGVYRIWGTLLAPRVVDGVLLPGTVIASIGHLVGLLVTGASVAPRDPKDQGPPPPPQPKIPVVGPIVVALLPMVGLVIGIYAVTSNLGRGILARLPQEMMVLHVPGSLAALWDQLRGLITLAEATLNALRDAKAGGWTIFFFVYLLMSLSVRLAPLPGKVFCHAGAIAGAGAIAALIGSVNPGLPEAIQKTWPMLTLTVGWLVLALLASMVIKGVVSGWRLAKGD